MPQTVVPPTEVKQAQSGLAGLQATGRTHGSAPAGQVCVDGSHIPVIVLHVSPVPVQVPQVTVWPQLLVGVPHSRPAHAVALSGVQTAATHWPPTQA